MNLGRQNDNEHCQMVKAPKCNNKINVTNKGEIYYINKATNTLNRKQPINKEQESSPVKGMGTLQKHERNSYNDELSYQDEHWKVGAAHEKRK